MRTQLFAAGTVALAGLVSGQTITEAPPAPTDPAADPCEATNPDRPYYCEPLPGEENVDPCAPVPGVEIPWFCDPASNIPGGAPAVIEYNDEVTGFRFVQYDAVFTVDESRIFYRIAVDDAIPEGAAYDAVIQIQAPNAVGWAALAWGGQMVDCPITMAWANCSNVVASQRYTSQRAFPPLDKAISKLEVMEVGTFVNSTHWQLTAKCIGCTSWNDPNSGPHRLDAKGTNHIAWAYANIPPEHPGNVDSHFGPHDVYNYFDADFNLGSNARLTASASAKMKAPTPTATADNCQFTWTPPPGAIVFTQTKTVTVATQTVTATVTVTPACP